MAPSVCVFMAQFTTYIRACIALYVNFLLFKTCARLYFAVEVCSRCNAQQNMRNSKIIIIIYNTIL